MKKRLFALFLEVTMVSSLLLGCGSEAWVQTEAPNVETSPAGGDYGCDDAMEAGGDYGYDGDAEAERYYDVTMEVQCSEASNPVEYYENGGGVVYNTEEYDAVTENGFMSVAASPVSTFSADVDTASYANVRRMIMDGYTCSDIPAGAVRTEEMVNYFSYDYETPEGNEPFAVTATIGDCPWNEDSKLLIMGLQTEAIDFSEAPASNIVFLLDVSGSMNSEDKLPLLKQAFSLLVENLDEDDRISIVTYASSNDVVLEGATGDERQEIMDALNSLEAGGSTNGGEGIITAYELAEEYFIPGGNNRVILATDGDLNVGITNQSDLEDLIEEKRESGVFLSVLGFGTGNYSDSNMETLADAGNGNYSYIDGMTEAKKVLVEELGATMVTVAKDVKLQVEFNPAEVAEYRLIGYDNRMLTTEDFEDDTRDAGEIGAGHSVTVIYEIVPATCGTVIEEELRYQDSTLSEEAIESGEWLSLSIRYKEPEEEESIELVYYFGEEQYTEEVSEDFLFAATVAEFAMVLKNSEYIGEGSLEHVLESLENMELEDEYREEFYLLVQMLENNEEYYGY